MARISSRSREFTSRGYKDFSLSFKSNPVTGDFSTLKNEEAIKQSVRNIVLTARGEKLFQPYFGSNLMGMLFENYSPFMIDAIRDEIAVSLQNNEIRIKILNIEVEDDRYDLNALSVTVEYQIIGQPVMKNFSFLLTKG